jgi:radical SAM modification target selenobiotic family peptide
MDAQKLKQFLAGISIAGLLAGGITLSCDKSGKSG